FGERGPPVVAALFSLAILLGVAQVAARLFGDWPAVLATAVLATSESFFRYGGATRLDPPLVLLANAAAVAVLFPRAGRPRWFIAGVLAALAVLVKGPFGLVRLVAAVAARAWQDRPLATLARVASARL